MSGMSDSKVDQEPSIEEILSSIRQIINEDDEEEINVAAAKKAEEVAPAAEDDTLDLDAFATEDTKQDVKTATEEAVTPETESEAPNMSDDKADKKVSADDLDAMFDAPEQTSVADNDSSGDDLDFAEVETPAVEVKEEPTPSTETAVEDALMSDDAISAAAASLTKLADAEIKIDHSHAGGGSSITLEDVMKQMLKPMMKEWLDANLPSTVERLVEKEIRKISNRS